MERRETKSQAAQPRSEEEEIIIAGGVEFHWGER